MRAVAVQPRNLQRGDELTDGAFVVEVFTDVDGTWVETSDGDAGYLTRPLRVIRELHEL